MLESNLMWILAFLMSVAGVVAVIAFSRSGGAGGGRPREFRAQDNPPRVLQIVWPVVIFIYFAYPFAFVAAPGIAYGTALNFAFPFDEVAQVLGLLLWLAGGLLVMWSGRALGRFMIIQIAVAKDHELITAGPYARMRHPTYAGVMCVAVGSTLLFLSYALAVFAALAILIANYRARKEERLLASPDGFGGAYRAYMARTGRFLPSVRPRT